MGRILFVLSLSVIATQCIFIKNAEATHKRVARSPCVDCDDWPPPPPGPPRPRYLHPYPRNLDYPPPPPPPPPFYYPHSGPPPPPFDRHHWHKVINDSDERDDDDEDYNDSASAVSGVTGQNSGQAFSMASAGINGGGNSKYSRYGGHSSGSQSVYNGRQSSENFESETGGNGFGDQFKTDAQAVSNVKSTNIGTSSSAGSDTQSSKQISFGSNAVSRQGASQSTTSSNAQSSQIGSRSSAPSNVQSYLDHNIKSSSSSEAQVGGQSTLSSSTSPEFGRHIGGSNNQHHSTNYGRLSSDGLDIQSSDHFSRDANLQSTSGFRGSAFSSSQSISGTKGSNNNFGQFTGSTAKTSSIGGSSSAESNAQSATGQESPEAAVSTSPSSESGDQSSMGLNVQSSKNLGSASARSHASASSVNGDLISYTNSKAQFNNSHHTSEKSDKQSFNNSGRSSLQSVVTQTSDNGLANKFPIDSKPLYSDNFNDFPSVSSSSKPEVSPQPSVSLNNQAAISFGGLSPESANTQFTEQKPLEDFSQSSNTFGDLPSGFNVQSSSSKSTLTSSKHSANHFSSSSSKSVHNYQNSFGDQSNGFNSQSSENSRSSEESKLQPLSKYGVTQPFSINGEPLGPIQPNTFSHKPSIDSDQPSNSFGYNFRPSNFQSQSNGFGDQTSGFHTQKSVNFGGSTYDKLAFQPSGTRPSGTSQLQPDGQASTPASDGNKNNFERSSEISKKGSNSQFDSYRHQFSTSYNKQSSGNSGDSFIQSNSQYSLGDQPSDYNGQVTENLRYSSPGVGNAQFGGPNHHNHGNNLDQSLKNVNGLGSKDFGQFSTIIHSSKNVDNILSGSPKIHPNKHSDETSANIDSQSVNSFDVSRSQRGDIPPSDDQIHIPLSGLTGVGNSENIGQGRGEFVSESNTYHNGDNTGSMENKQQSSSSQDFGSISDNLGPVTVLSGITASDLRKSFRLNDTGSSYDSSLEKPKTGYSDFGGQSSANFNGQFSNSFEGSGRFSDLNKQSLHNFSSLSLSKSEAQSSSSISPSSDTNNQPKKINSDLSEDQSSFNVRPSTGNKQSNGFDINSSNMNTQSSSSFGGWSLPDSNIHSFSVGDQMCVCGPRKSPLFTAISKSGASNGFDDQPTESRGKSSSGIDIQTSGGSFGTGFDDQSTNDQINKQRNYSLQNGKGAVDSHDVQFGGNGDEKEQIDSSEINGSSGGSNNNGLYSARKSGSSPLPNLSTPPSRLLLPPLGSPQISNSPANSPRAGTIPSPSENIGNNDQRKEHFESQQNEYHEDTGANTDQQQTSDFGPFGSGSGISGSDFTSSDSKGGNGFGIQGIINGGQSFGSSSHFSSSYSRDDGVHGSIDDQGFPNGYGSGHFDTESSFSLPFNLRLQSSQAPTGSGGISYASSNARSKNQDAFAVSVGL